MANRQMYTTIETVLLYLDTGAEQGSLAPDDAYQRAYLWQQIGLASAMVEQHVGRSFVPYAGDVSITAGNLWDSATAAVPQGVIALTAVNGAAPADYVLLPVSSAIGHFLYADMDDGWGFAGFSGSATLTGWFGYHPDYAQAWQTVEAVTLDASQTSITVADDIRYETGDTLRIEDELLLVTGITADTLAVERGINGTSAAAHASKDVQRYLLPEPVKQVTTEIVAWLYKNRHRVNEVFAVPGGTVRVGSFDPELYKPLNRYRMECANITPYG